MNLDRFVETGRPSWNELERLIASSGGRPERLGPAGVRSMGELYRTAAADLAFARRRFPGDPVVVSLEALVGRGRHLVYGATVRRESFVEFFSHGYWRRIRERPAALVISVALLAVPTILAWLWAQHDPGAAAGVVPSAMRAVGEPKRNGAHLGLGVSVRSSLASQIFTNNIRVTFVAFAGGVTGGFATAASLAFNGLLFGVVGGLASGAGQTSTFVQLIVPHGVLELSCIVVAGAAGLRMGWALVAPGRMSRADSLAAEARRGVELALGTAVWLVLAGLVEGFITPVGIGVVPALVLGFGLGAIYWGLVIWRGSPPPAQLKAERLPST